MGCKYISRTETEGDITIETRFDSSQFGDVELFGTIMQFKHLEKISGKG